MVSNSEVGSRQNMHSVFILFYFYIFYFYKKKRVRFIYIYIYFVSNFFFIFYFFILFLFINYFILFFQKKIQNKKNSKIFAIRHSENFANIAKFSLCLIFAKLAKFR